MLGMTPEAAHGWARLHVKPYFICTGYHTGVIATLGTFAGVFFMGFPWFTWHAHSAMMLFLPGLFGCQCMIWRWGPMASAKPLYNLCILVMTIGGAGATVPAFVGPLRFTPFRNRPLSTGLIAVAAFFLNLSGSLGGVPANHPHQPHTSMWVPVFDAFSKTRSTMDALTDLGMTPVFLEAVRC
jgi:hypothetical protein